jgi:hypothetical protein
MSQFAKVTGYAIACAHEDIDLIGTERGTRIALSFAGRANGNSTVYTLYGRADLSRARACTEEKDPAKRERVEKIGSLVASATTEQLSLPLSSFIANLPF